jgi:hypothetical protein
VEVDVMNAFLLHHVRGHYLEFGEYKVRCARQVLPMKTIPITQ